LRSFLDINEDIFPLGATMKDGDTRGKSNDSPQFHVTKTEVRLCGTKNIQSNMMSNREARYTTRETNDAVYVHHDFI